MQLLFEIIEEVINNKLKTINGRINKLSEIMYVTPARHIDREVAGKISLEYQKAAAIREKWKQVKRLIDEILSL